MNKNPALNAFFVVFVFSQSSHAQNLQCVDVARTLKEFSISTSSSSYLNSVFDNYCEASGSTKEAGGSFGIDAVIKAIPVKFTGSYSSSEEAMRNFCKTYASSSSLQERKYSYEEKIAGKALDTVSDCLKLQAQGVVITHDVANRERMSFFLKSGVDQKITLSGVYSSGGVSCSGLVKGKGQPFTESTFIPKINYQGFTCLRAPQVSTNPNVKLFEEAVIIVSTNLGNYNVLWPRDERISEDMASAISINIDSIKRKTDENSVSISTVLGAKTVPVFRCPTGKSPGWGPGGACGSYGCEGQISTNSTCKNIEYPHEDVRACEPIGSLRLY